VTALPVRVRTTERKKDAGAAGACMGGIEMHWRQKKALMDQMQLERARSWELAERLVSMQEELFECTEVLDGISNSIVVCERREREKWLKECRISLASPFSNGNERRLARKLMEILL
jgi:hypothetical protein